MKKLPLLVGCVWMLMSFSLCADPIISEFLASNDSELADEDGEFSDWIEIHNPDAVAINLAGWHLSDDAADLSKWTFPTVSIPAGGYLVVFASSKDKAVAGSELHTNFKLASSGEYLALIKPDGITKSTEFLTYPPQNTDISYGVYGSITLVSSQAALKYTLSSPASDAEGDTWTEHDFDDSAWIATVNGGAPAIAGLGYDNGSDYLSVIHTPVASGTKEVWVRFPFTVTDPTTLSHLLLRMRYDDGFAAYLNGTLVSSANISAPIQGLESHGFIDFNLSAYPNVLLAGANVLSVRLVDTLSSNSDLLLVPELTASDTLALSNYVYLTEPSPGAANLPGVLNLGPIISETTNNPPPTDGSADLLITSRVQERIAALDTVTLKYRIGFANEVSLMMRDDGLGGDAIASDQIYSTRIPASAMSPGSMVRWSVAATDSAGQSSRMPLQVDTTGNSQSPGYYGTVIQDSGIGGNAPIFQWFTQNESASNTDAGTRASVYFAGTFYDNIYVRRRGQSSNGSQKFDFNKGFPFYASVNLPSVGEVNINSRASDSSYIRQPLAFDFHRQAGHASSDAFAVHMRVNGSFDRVGLLIEQVDKDFLRRFGYDDAGGELYKFTQRKNLAPVFDDITTGVARKTGDENDMSSLAALVSDLKQSNQSDRIDRFYDNMDVAEFVNYMAARCVMQHADDVRKNFYMFRDTAGDGRWRIFPWDLDWTLGISGNHGATRVEHPFFGVEAFPVDNSTAQWSRLYDVAFEDITMQRLYLRRVRTLMDTYLTTSASNGWLENRINEIYATMSGLPGPSSSAKNSLRDKEVQERRSDLYNQFTSNIQGFSPVIPNTQTSTPDVVIDEVDFNPVGGNQDQEYIRLTNHESTEVDISGWRLELGVSFTFPPGTVIPRNGSIYVSPDSAQFLARAISPKANERRLVFGPYAGHLSSFGESIVLSDAADQVVQLYTFMGAPSLAQQHLVVSEFHYHPGSNSAAEYIEITNISPTVTVDLTGVYFSNGVDFDFSGSAITSLAPGEFVLVVKNYTSFEAVYGTSVSTRIAGVFANGTELNNSGEEIKLKDSTNSTIHRFTYSSESPWPATSGASLVLKNPTTRPDHDDPENWMVSSSVEGSPGGATARFDFWLVARGQSDPLSDPDGDGWSELLTYAMGRDLSGSGFVYQSRVETLVVNSVEGEYLTIETTLRSGADTMPTLQLSSDLDTWLDATPGTDVFLISDVDNGDGTRRLKYRSHLVITSGAKQFIRMSIPLP